MHDLGFNDEDGDDDDNNDDYDDDIDVDKKSCDNGYVK